MLIMRIMPFVCAAPGIAAKRSYSNGAESFAGVVMLREGGGSRCGGSGGGNAATLRSGGSPVSSCQAGAFGRCCLPEALVTLTTIDLPPLLVQRHFFRSGRLDHA